MGRLSEQLVGDQRSLRLEVLTGVRGLSMAGTIGSQQGPSLGQRTLRSPCLATAEEDTVDEDDSRTGAPAMDVEPHGSRLFPCSLVARVSSGILGGRCRRSPHDDRSSPATDEIRRGSPPPGHW
jgi:hypothetical protein